MAANKKSFILYCDLLLTVSKLPDDIAGKLFKIILEYVNDKNPEVNDLLLQVAFEPVKQQLKRDLIKYEGKKIQWSEAGKESARIRALNKNNESQQTLTDVTNRSTDSTVTVTVNDTVTVNVNDKEKYISEFENFWNLYDKKIGDKKKLLKKWVKLTTEEKTLIFKYIPEYKNATPEKKFRKNPETFFNQKGWLDEIIIENKIIQNGTHITNTPKLNIKQQAARDFLNSAKAEYSAIIGRKKDS